MSLDLRDEDGRGRRCKRRSRLIHLADKLVDELVGLRVRYPLQEQGIYLSLRELVADICGVGSVQKLHYILLKFKRYYKLHGEKVSRG